MAGGWVAAISPVPPAGYPDAELEGPTPRKRGRGEERKRGRKEERKRGREEERKRGRGEDWWLGGWWLGGWWLWLVAGRRAF